MSSTTYHLEVHPEFSFLQIKPTPSQDEIIRFYTKEFYTSAYQRFNNSSLDVQTIDKEFFDAHREDMCSTIETLSGKSLNGQEVLDIGCGWCQSLLYFRTKGMVCFGFDPCQDAVNYAHENNLNVVKADLTEMDVFRKKFDVVTLLNVLEHVADPVSMLREIKSKILKRNGVLIIESPNEFNAFQKAGKEVHGLEEWWVVPPSHLNYFSHDNLCKLLEGTGYQVRLTESSFPMELFLLFGDNYVKDRAIGRKCHERRINFEMNLRKYGYVNELRSFYQALAKKNLGRQITAYAANQ